MIELDPIESRVFGVLVEKVLTTPAQYPLSLNAATNGCNQKSNRSPVASYREEQVLDALDRLRAKGMVTTVDTAGGRVLKYRHNGKEALGVETLHLAVLAELLMRGPQTVGEIRTRASRMRAFESLDAAENVVSQLIQRDPPLVKRLPPAPGSRAALVAQLLAPDLHPTGDPPVAQDPAETAASSDPTLPQRVEALEREIDSLKTYVRDLAAKLGEPAPSDVPMGAGE